MTIAITISDSHHLATTSRTRIVTNTIASATHCMPRQNTLRDMRIGILGGGRAAWAYGSAWRRIGWPIDGVWLRRESQSKLPDLLGAPRKSIASLDADLLLIAVSDRAIDEVASLIPPTNAIIFHAS